MISQNPWAWLGLATVALPVLIHLLGRGHARVLPFPSLRFLERSRLLPTRRTRIHDLLLLIVRAGILVAAVAALAQPLFLSSRRTRALDQTLARAIIVDSSASMRRGVAFDSARAAAQRLAAGAQISTVIETAEPARALRGAVEWLDRQSGSRELVVVSDFQIGTLDSADLAVVPATIGVQPSRIAPSSNAPLAIQTLATRATVTLSADNTSAEWSASTSPRDSRLVLLAATADANRAEAAARAAATVATRLPLDSTRRVAIIFPSYEGRAELSRTSKPIDVPWMTSVAASLRTDSLLIGATTSETSLTTDLDSTRLVVARSSAGNPLVVAARDNDRLLLFASIDPGSIAAAALIAAVDRARSVAPPLTELDPRFVPEQTIAAWQRPAAPTSGNSSGESDGRWFWVVALILLGIETWLRRARREAVVAELTHDRAA